MKKKKTDKLNYFQCVRFLLPFLSRLKVQCILFYLGCLFETIAGVVSTILFGIMIDQIVYYKQIRLFAQIGVVFFVLILFECVVWYFTYEVYSYLWNKLNYNVRIRLFGHMQEIEAEDMANQNYGDLMVMIRWYTMDCVHFFVRDIVHNINNYMRIIVCMVILFRIHPILGAAMLIMVPASVFISFTFGKTARNASGKNKELYGEYVSWLMEILGALREIRLLGAEKRVHHLFRKKQDDLIQTDIQVSVANVKAEQWLGLSNTVFQLMLYAVLSFLALKSSLMIGSVVVALTYFTVLKTAFQNISQSYMNAQGRIAIIQRHDTFLNLPTGKDWPGKKKIRGLDGRIDLQKLTFSYENTEPVLKGLDLSLMPGERVALVGESGCGKSTLAYMLIGFYRARRGKILLDGCPVEDYTLTSLRENIGFVQQDVLIFDGTVRENIILGKPDATDEEIYRACKAAGIYEFIDELEEGLDTVLGYDGRELSGGQKQRIILARIYLKDPKIIIFDEATSALDSDTEQKIHKQWENVLKGRTAIIIAHRLSSVMLCDRVAVLADGVIRETGTPEEMFKNSEIFRTLFAIKEGVTDDQ